MAKVAIIGKNLQVSIGILETIQALQGSFSVPLKSIRGATVDPDYIKAGLGFRSPGTGFPGLIAKGTFRRHGQKVLSLWKRGQEVVVIELADGKWDRVLLGCKDAKSITNEINLAIAE
jgi:hypothetical protein